jgi:hypothetical protein
MKPLIVAGYQVEVSYPIDAIRRSLESSITKNLSENGAV